MTQGPKTPSPTSEASLDDEKISPSEDIDPKSLESCRAKFHPTEMGAFKGFPGVKRIHGGHYKNRTLIPTTETLDPSKGTQDPSAEIAERFPLDANL